MFKDPDVMNKSAVTFLVCSGGSGRGNIGRGRQPALGKTADIAASEFGE